MGDFIKNIVTPLSAVVAALLAAWVNYSVSQVKAQIDLRQQEVQEKLKQQELALDALMTERNVKKLDEDLTFRVYEAVTASLKSNDEKQQQAASALVVVMAAEPLRTQLLQVFGASQTTVPEVRQAVGERSGQSARDSAAAIAKELTAQGAKGRIRARLLPNSINAKPGYRVAGYAIRRDANEAAQSDALKSLAERVVPSAQFEIVTSNQATRWYLSAFVCP